MKRQGEALLFFASFAYFAPLRETDFSVHELIHSFLRRGLLSAAALRLQGIQPTISVTISLSKGGSFAAALQGASRAGEAGQFRFQGDRSAVLVQIRMATRKPPRTNHFGIQ